MGSEMCIRDSRGSPFTSRAVTGIKETQPTERPDAFRITLMSPLLVMDGTVPDEAQPLQLTENVIDCPGFDPGRIKIVDSQMPGSPLTMGIQIAGKRRQQGACMQGAARCRRKTPPIGGGLLERVSGIDRTQPTCLSLISSRVLQSMHWVAVGRASSRLRPISIPQVSQYP